MGSVIPNLVNATKSTFSVKNGLMGVATGGIPTTKLHDALDPGGLSNQAVTPTAPPVPPPAPNMDNGQAALDLAALEQSKALARGRSATLLTGGAGLADLGTSSKTLLGR